MVIESCLPHAENRYETASVLTQFVTPAYTKTSAPEGGGGHFDENRSAHTVFYGWTFWLILNGNGVRINIRRAPIEGLTRATWMNPLI